MAKCNVEIRLPQTNYPAGGNVRGEVVIHAPTPLQTQGVSIELEWRTHGRGNRDSSAISRETLLTGPLEGDVRLPFNLLLPNGPVTYYGELINVEWVLKARVDVNWAIDPKAETVIRMTPAKLPPDSYQHGGSLPPTFRSGSVRGPGFPLWGILMLGLFASLGLSLLGWSWLKQDPFFLLLGAGFTLIPGVIAFVLLQRRIAEFRLGTVQVDVSNPTPLPGDTLQVAFDLAPPKAIAIGDIRAVLRGYERAIHGSGTRKTTHTKEFFRQSLSLSEGPERLLALEPRNFTGLLTLPQDAPPSFHSSNNDVRWDLEVHIEIPHWPDWKHSVPLAVKPSGT